MKSHHSIIMTIIAVMIAGQAHAGQFGAPQPMAKDGGFSVGFGYFDATNQWEPNDNDTPAYWKVSARATYAQVTGNSRNVEGYLRIGGINLDADEKDGAGRTFVDAGRTFVAVGGKGYKQIDDYIGAGPFLQATLYGQFRDTVDMMTVEVQRGAYDISAGAALQAGTDMICLYAGPFIRLSRAEADITYGASTATVKAEPQANFGGMGGIRARITKQLAIEAEAQYTDEFSFGCMFSINF